MVESDGIYTISNIVKAVGISPLRVHFILKPIWKVWKISTRLISHILTDDQNRWGVNSLSNCLKCFPNWISENLRILLLVTKMCFIFLTSKKNLTQNIIKTCSSQKNHKHIEFSLLHILFIWRYYHTNSSAEGQKCYASILPKCYTKKRSRNIIILKRRPLSGISYSCRHFRLL